MKYNQIIILFISALTFISCSNNAKYEDCGKAGWHRITFSEFSVITPNHVQYLPQKGQDSFVGDLIGDAVSLTFDYGAYSNALIPTPAEYIKSNEWLSYVRSDVFVEMRTKDSTFEYPNENEFSIVSVKADSADEWKYYATLKFRDSILTQSFTYPREYQIYEFETDTIDNKYIKIVYPMVTHKGQMGVYIENLQKKEGGGNYPKLTVVFMTNEASDEYKLEILRSVKMK